MPEQHDVIIIGGGPAGYSAALYCARYGLRTAVLEKFSPGGQMTQTHTIDNYPGFDDGVDGFALGEKMKAGAERFGAITRQTEVLSAILTPKVKCIATDAGDHLCKAVIIATGAVHKHLGVPGEKELIGRGVGYCASCDGMLYRGKTVAVVGGGNSAVTDAILLSGVCKKVYLIHRRDRLRADRVVAEPLERTNNIEILWNCSVDSFIYEEALQGVRLKNSRDRTEPILKIDGLFVSIGQSPATGIFSRELSLDSHGYIVASEDTRTNIPGIFAAGDVRTKPLRQIVTAAADGAVAAYFAKEYIADQQGVSAVR